MKRKIIATLLILLVFLFPFRIAFLSPEVTGIMSLLNFALVVTGIIGFLFLTLPEDKKEAH